MPAVTTNVARRPSNYEQGSSIDPGLSGLSSSSSDSRLNNDSSYSSQGFYGGGLRDSRSSHNYTMHRSLPTPTQHTYDRVPQSYSAVDNSGIKESMWSIGNASTGHGHYIASQQWTSAGTS
jgi:hypothetical protein